MARNYIILNGVNSNTITGLLISTLPPITKPKQRTQIEEIDGRDGDIVTKLGYSAYEKAFEIGLYGDFDINEVISYFNTEGNVVFSNESDKYYKYQILDQIDYEKLIRFKTATVKMHVQPFKYPTEEEQIQVDATVVTGSGSNITLEYTSSGNIITSEVDGDTQQDGTPTPDSPVAVQTVTGNQSIKIEGKNLCPTQTFTAIARERLVSTASYNETVYGIPAVAGQTYTASFNITTLPSSDYRIQFINSSDSTQTQGTTDPTNRIDRQQLTCNALQKYSISITPTQNGYLYLRCVPAGFVLDNIQIEKGSTASEDYYPYNSQTYSISLGSIELCKIGNYQDRIYQNEGTWYIEKQTGKVVLNGTEEGWSKSGSTDCDRFYVPILDLNTLNTSYGLSNYYKYNVNLANALYEFKYEHNSASSKDRVFINHSAYGTTTLQQYKTWLASNNVNLYYALETPTTTEITDADLLAQLNELAGATTYENQTNITVSGSLPASLSVSTQGMPNTVINNIGNIYAKPLITIYGSGNIGVYLNYIQVLQIALGDAGSITIDVAKMEAYNSSTQVLMNRLVTGDYMNFLINSGQNNLAFSGNVLGFTMDNYTRWI